MQKSLYSWFASTPLPSLVEDISIVVGGTGLLLEFLAQVCSSRTGGALSIAVPFVGNDITVGMKAWEVIPHAKVDFLIVTRHRRDAQIARSQFRLFPWRSLLICYNRVLHAKVYSFIATKGVRSCLIGSHNLSMSGAHINEEAGVLLRGNPDDAVDDAIRHCAERIGTLARAGTELLPGQ